MKLYPFNPTLVSIIRKRRSTTQGSVILSYDGVLLEHYGDGIQLCADGQYRGYDNAYWITAAKRAAIRKGLATGGNGGGFDVASNQLTENYFAPVPSQFSNMPRATARAGEVSESGFSAMGYARALADDCLAMTGCIDGGRIA